MNPVDPDVPEIVTGTKNMLLFQFRVEMDLVIGKRHLAIGIDNVTPVAVAFPGPDSQAACHDRQIEGSGKPLKVRQERLAAFEQRKLAVQWDHGIPQLGQDHTVAAKPGCATEVIEDPACVAPGVPMEKLQLDKADSEFVHRGTSTSFTLYSSDYPILHMITNLFSDSPSINGFSLYNLWVPEMLERQNGRECDVSCSTPSDHRDP